MLSMGTSLDGSVAMTHSAMMATCATVLSVALVATGVDLEYEFTHKRIICPPCPWSMRNPQWLVL
jgi:hypothetical protein